MIPTVMLRLSCLSLAYDFRARSRISEVAFWVRALWSNVRALGAEWLALRGSVGKERRR